MDDLLELLHELGYWIFTPDTCLAALALIVLGIWAFCKLFITG